MKKRNQLLFIYGTLRRGGRAHHLMSDADFITHGSVSGKLLHIDQYPGLILEGEGAVRGELYSLDSDLLQELDRYEGCFESPVHYLRVAVEVLLDNGRTQEADVYVFQQRQPHHEVIESGDWFDWVNENKKA